MEKEKVDLLDQIKKLSKTSSIEEILDCLFYDMKQEAQLDVEKIKKNKESLSLIGLDENDIKDKLKWENPKDSKDKNVYIKNWLKYKVCIKEEQLYTPKFDSDCTLNSKQVLKEALYQKVKNEFSKDDITLDGNRTIIIKNKNEEEIKLDTDTMNSYATTFNGTNDMNYGFINLLRNKGIERNNKYFKNLKPNEKIDYITILSEMDTIFDNIEDKDELELIKQFNIFAKLQNTIGNFVLVPYVFNGSRGVNTEIQDYWDLTLLYLKSKDNIEKEINKGVNLIKKEEAKPRRRIELENSYNWYIKNYDKIILVDWIDDRNNIKYLYDGHVKEEPIPKDISDMLKCVKEINIRIIKRGLHMLKILNQDLDSIIDVDNMKISYKDIMKEIIESID